MASQDETTRPPAPPAAAPPAAPTPPVDAPLRTRPPSPRDRLTVWLLLLAILVLAAPPIFIEIQQPYVVTDAEARSVLRAVHTRETQRQANLTWGEMFTPFINNQPDWRSPPGVTWVQLALLRPFELMTTNAPPPTQWVWLWYMVRDLRLISAGMALLAIASVFWAGHSIGGARTAAFAGAVCATTPMFVLHGREASTPIFYAAWSLLSIAAALWALRPLRPTPSLGRQALGWAICGLAMGMATLTIGPAAIIGLALPIMLFTVLCPNRVSHLLGLLASLILAALVVLPWAAYANQRDADAWSLDWMAWASMQWIDTTRMLGAAGARTVILPLALLPWTIWILGAVVQPFSTSSKGVRVKLFLGWGWFIVAAVLFLIAPQPTRDIFLVAAIPAAAVLIAEVFTQYADLAATGRWAHLWWLLRWVHIAFLVLASAAVVLLLQGQTHLIEAGWIEQAWLTELGWWYAVPLGVALLTIVAMTLRPKMQALPALSLVFWLIWSAVLLTALAVPFARSPAQHSDLPYQAQVLLDEVGDNPIYWWGSEGDDPVETDPQLTLYLGRVVPLLTATDLDFARQQHDRFYLLVPVTAPPLPRDVDVEQAPIQPLVDRTLLMIRGNEGILTQ